MLDRFPETIALAFWRFFVCPVRHGCAENPRARSFTTGLSVPGKRLQPVGFGIQLPWGARSPMCFLVALQLPSVQPLSVAVVASIRDIGASLPRVERTVGPIDLGSFHISSSKMPGYSSPGRVSLSWSAPFPRFIRPSPLIWRSFLDARHCGTGRTYIRSRSEEHTSELQ